MIYKNFFSKTATREAIIKSIKKDGFEPELVENEPGFVYELHQHPETKLIVCLEGSMKVTINGKEHEFEPGDKIRIPGNTPHSAVAGKNGCKYYWSERLVNLSGDLGKQRR